jgi:hypothetical protein
MIGMARLLMHEAQHRRSGAILENLHTVRRVALSQANIWSREDGQLHHHFLVNWLLKRNSGADREMP